MVESEKRIPERAEERDEYSSTPFGKVRFNEKRSKTWRLFALCVIALVPLIYVALFLITAQDPYGGMKQVPAVVVNLDKGAEIDGEKRNVGQELSDSLIEDNALAVEGDVSGFNWSFTTSETKAAQSLRDGAYYMEIVIPENFSAAIASAGTSKAEQAELKVYYNPSVSFGAQTVGQNLIVRVVDELNEKVQGDYLGSIFLTMKEAGDDLLTLANAGLDLTDGLFTARDGSSALSEGLGQLADGNAQLTSGLYEAGDGAQQLADGANQLAGGVEQLADGIGQLKEGIEGGTSTPEAIALADAMADIGYYLQLFGDEMMKPNPDTDAEQAYLNGAAAAAQRAAAANETIGDPLVAYISGGSFSYNAGGSTVTCTETGLIQAVADYVAASNALEAFERDELEPLLVLLQQLGESVEGMGDAGDRIVADVEDYYDAVENATRCTQLYRAALNAYGQALEDFAAGTITAEELAAYAAAVETASANMVAAEAAVVDARQQIIVDLPDLADAISIARSLWNQIGSIEHVEALINELMALIEDQARAGAAVQGAAGKIEGYLVGVAVMSSYMSESMSVLADAVGQIYTAVAIGTGDSPSLVEGTSQLASGASSLAEGIYTAADGSNTITLSLATVASGSQSLTDGMTMAASTSGTLFEGLLSGKETIDEQTANSETRTEVLSNPVTVNGDRHNGESITTVANYGTSIAPYYLGLGLWLGCLLTTLVLRPIDERRFRQRGSSFTITMTGFAPLAGVALAQALIALAVVQFGLNMNVSFPVAYYLVGAVAALAFAALNQFLVGNFGMGGIFASVVLLAAQLCMASGTFPIESAFSLLGIASMLMPMTYVVRGLRVAMCGLGVEYTLIPAAVLAGVAILALLLTVAVVALRRKKGQAPAGGKKSKKAPSVEHVVSTPSRGAERPTMTQEQAVEAALCDEDEIDIEEALEPPAPTTPSRVPLV